VRGPDSKGRGARFNTPAPVKAQVGGDQPARKPQPARTINGGRGANPTGTAGVVGQRGAQAGQKQAPTINGGEGINPLGAGNIAGKTASPSGNAPTPNGTGRAQAKARQLAANVRQRVLGRRDDEELAAHKTTQADSGKGPVRMGTAGKGAYAATVKTPSLASTLAQKGGDREQEVNTAKKAAPPQKPANAVPGAGTNPRGTAGVQGAINQAPAPKKTMTPGVTSNAPPAKTEIPGNAQNSAPTRQGVQKPPMQNRAVAKPTPANPGRGPVAQGVSRTGPSSSGKWGVAQDKRGGRDGGSSEASPVAQAHRERPFPIGSHPQMSVATKPAGAGAKPAGGGGGGFKANFMGGFGQAAKSAIMNAFEPVYRTILSEEKDEHGHWVKPDDDSLRTEYKVEYGHHFKHSHGDHFPSYDDFHKAVHESPVEHITPDKDRHVGGRSHTKSFDDLHDLIKGYRSYPKYRNEKTLRALSDRVRDKQPTHLPIIMQHHDGRRQIFSGNTRADLANQHHGSYHAIVVDVKKHSKLGSMNEMRLGGLPLSKNVIDARGKDFGPQKPNHWSAKSTVFHSPKIQMKGDRGGPVVRSVPMAARSDREDNIGNSVTKANPGLERPNTADKAAQIKPRTTTLTMK
jgi:hypothetical protein